MVDQKTIAEKAGVSRATVSRAFTQNANVSPRSLAKIQAAMESLGLQPLAWFPSDIRKKSKYVLILCGDISNAFFSQVIKGISDRLLALGLLPVVWASFSSPPQSVPLWPPPCTAPIPPSSWSTAISTPSRPTPSASTTTRAATLPPCT